MLSFYWHETSHEYQLNKKVYDFIIFKYLGFNYKNKFNKVLEARKQKYFLFSNSTKNSKIFNNKS